MTEHEAIKAARNAYARAYYAKNRERIQENQKRYWAKKAAEMQQTAAQQDNKQEEEQ